MSLIFTTYLLNNLKKEPVIIVDVLDTTTGEVLYEEAFNSVGEYNTWYSENEDTIGSMSVTSGSGVLTDTTSMFSPMAGSTILETVDITHMETESVVKMSKMFENCSHLTEIVGIDTLNTNNVTDMSNMFNGCSALPELNLVNFDMTKVTNTDNMFVGCSAVENSYGRTQADCDKLNASTNRPDNVYFGLRPPAVILLTGTNASGSVINEGFDSQEEMKTWITANKTEIKTLKIVSGSGVITNVKSLFNSCSALEIIDLSECILTDLTITNGMFSNCPLLTTITFAPNTSFSQVTDLGSMFSSCPSLTTINNMPTDMINADRFGGMFYNCSSFADNELISQFQTPKAWDISSMFYNCSSLTELDLTGWNLDSVYPQMGTSNMFPGCTSVVVSTASTQYYCDLLNAHSYNRPKNVWFTVPLEYTVSGTYTDDSTFEETLSYADYLIWSNTNKELVKTLVISSNTQVVSQTPTFEGFVNMTEINVIGVDVTKTLNYDRMFYNCSSLTEIDLTSWNTSYATEPSTDTFVGCSAVIVGYANNTASANYWNSTINKPENVVFRVGREGQIRVSGLLFGYEPYNETFNSEEEFKMWMWDMGSFASSMVIDSDVGVFTNCDMLFDSKMDLTTIDVTNMDTSMVTIMSFMFSNSPNLTEIIGLENWNTSCVRSMDIMFGGCSSLTSLDLSGWDTRYVLGMTSMFGMMTNLTSVNVSNFDTRQVTTLQGMFEYCPNITELDLSSFDMSITKSIDNMFADCTGVINAWGKTRNDCDILNASTNKAENVIFKIKNPQIIVDVLDTTTGEVLYEETFTTVVEYNKWYSNNEDTVESMSVSSGVLTDTTSMFSPTTDTAVLESVDITHLETQNVVKMSRMFENCSTLTEIVGIESVDTANVTDMESMFDGCSALPKLDLTNFDMTKVINTDNMFNGCVAVTESFGRTEADCDKLNASTNRPDNVYFGVKPIVINLEDFYVYYSTGGITMTEQFSLALNGNTDYVVDGQTVWKFGTPLPNPNRPDLNPDWEVSGTLSVFMNSTTATKIDLSLWDCYGVSYINNLFYNCHALKEVNLNGFSARSISRATNMFANCTSLETVDVSFLEGHPLRRLQSMFYGCTNLKEIIGLEKLDLSNVDYTTSMFYNCSSLLKIDLGETSFNGSASTNDMFTGCTSVVESWAMTDYDAMILNASDNRPDNVYFKVFFIPTIWMTGTNILDKVMDKDFPDEESFRTYMRSGGVTSSAKHLKIRGNPSVFTDMSSMFESYTYLESIDISEMDLSSVSNFSRMFYYCPKLTTITGLETMNMSSATTTNRMFFSSTSLPSLNMSGVSNANVTDMDYMFANCSSLTSLSFPTTSTKLTTAMGLTFGCSKLGSINFNINTTNVTSFKDMFKNCSSLTTLNLNNVKMSKVTDMSNMFEGCSKLTSISRQSWDTSKVTNWTSTFNGCSKLTEMDFSQLNLSALSTVTTTFTGCTSVNISYGRTQAECDKLNTSTSKPSNINFTLVPPIILSGTYTSNTAFSVGFQTASSAKSWIASNKSSVKTLKYNDPQGLTTSLDSLFEDMINVESIDISNFNGANVSGSLTNMCAGCVKLKSMNFTNFKPTGFITSMNYMFQGCTSLTAALGMNNFKTDVSQSRIVTSCAGIFQDCSSLTEKVDLSGIQVVDDVGYLYKASVTRSFQNCTSLDAVKVRSSLDQDHFQEDSDAPATLGFTMR